MSERGSPSPIPRPGAAALTNLALIEADNKVFKLPATPGNAPKKRTRTKVLDEEDYIEGIARIIQRDFFPDLEKLRAQNEYLEACENRDYVRLREITLRYSGAKPKTHSSGDATPATFETPTVHPGSPQSAELRQEQVDSKTEKSAEDAIEEITKKHSLDSYLAKHTSEDNYSYDKLIGLEEKKRALRSATQLEAEATSAELADRALVLPSIEQQADQTERPFELDTWKFKAKNFIMYVPDGDKNNVVQHKNELIHDNTRLKMNPFSSLKTDDAKPKHSLCPGKVNVDGTHLEAAAPLLGTHSLVATPSPRPGALGDESPLMTWGEIEGTPFRLDGGDTPIPALGSGKSYRMLEWGARERIGLKLAEQAAKKRRPTTPQLRTPSPSVRIGTNRLSTMSPAARKFAAKHLLSPRMRISPAPTGLRSRSTTPVTPGRSYNPATSKKPVAKKPLTPKHDNTLTDNLLKIQLPSRLKAKDFFN